MVPVGSSVMLELVLAVHSYHVIAYTVYGSVCVNSTTHSDKGKTQKVKVSFETYDIADENERTNKVKPINEHA